GAAVLEGADLVPLRHLLQFIRRQADKLGRLEQSVISLRHDEDLEEGRNGNAKGDCPSRFAKKPGILPERKGQSPFAFQTCAASPSPLSIVKRLPLNARQVATRELGRTRRDFPVLPIIALDSRPAAATSTLSEKGPVCVRQRSSCSSRWPGLSAPRT